jgi:putative hydrolases of HD superfamily
MDIELQSVLSMMEIIGKFKNIKRKNFVGDSNPRRLENDAEHSYELTLLAWFLISKHKLNLNIDKVVKYALVHDLVEVYAGDIDPYMYANSFEMLKIKKINEESALKRLEQELKDTPDLINSLKDYEKMADEESKFVYVLDKVACQLGIVYIDGRNMNDCGVSLATAENVKNTKMNKSKDLVELYEEVFKKWKQTPGFFAEKDYTPEYKKEFLQDLKNK